MAKLKLRNKDGSLTSYALANGRVQCQESADKTKIVKLFKNLDSQTFVVFGYDRKADKVFVDETFQALELTAAKKRYNYFARVLGSL